MSQERPGTGRATRQAGTREPRPATRPGETRIPQPQRTQPQRTQAQRTQPQRTQTQRPQPQRTQPQRTHTQRPQPQPVAPARRSASSRPTVPPPPHPRGIARLWSPRPGDPRRRQAMALGLTLVLLAVLAGRLVWVQGVAGSALAAESLSGRMTTVAIPADRGDIVDRNGVVLATSLERYNIVVNQRQLAQWKPDGSGPGRAAELLADLVGIPAVELGPKLMGDRGFAYVTKGLVPEVTEEILALGIHGITAERTTERIYPAGTTGGNILGFTGGEGTGLAGIEQVYEDELTGVAGEESFERGALGQRIPGGDESHTPAVPGSSVRLTIDRDLQYAAQASLDAQVRATGATWGIVEVQDVRTGEILVLAESGTQDPNAPTEAIASRAVASVYEPGSTAKVITMAAVLDHGIAAPTSQYVVPYRYTTSNGQTFKDSHEHPDLKLTLAGILAESSNTGTVMVGEQLSREVRHEYLTRFGLGTRAGVGLPGESAGILAAPETWDGRSQFAVLFGQAVSVTTVQATQVFATIANGGVRVQPHVVAGTIGPDGTETPVELAADEQVISPETAQTIMTMLEAAVADGTGSHASVAGYRIAGKTGTAQAFEGGGVVKNVASFIGIAPADDPHIVVNVVLYDPKTSIYGGVVAAPVFSEVAGHALRYLGVPPSGTTPILFPTTYE